MAWLLWLLAWLANGLGILAAYDWRVDVLLIGSIVFQLLGHGLVCFGLAAFLVVRELTPRNLYFDV